MFLVPLVITDGIMAAATMRRWATLVRENLAVSMRRQVRTAAPWIAVMIVAMLVARTGITVLTLGSQAQAVPMRP
jgi:hypothetical protein